MTCREVGVAKPRCSTGKPITTLRLRPAGKQAVRRKLRPCLPGSDLRPTTRTWQVLDQRMGVLPRFLPWLGVSMRGGAVRLHIIVDAVIFFHRKEALLPPVALFLPGERTRICRRTCDVWHDRPTLKPPPMSFRCFRTTTISSRAVDGHSLLGWIVSEGEVWSDPSKVRAVCRTLGFTCSSHQSLALLPPGMSQG